MIYSRRFCCTFSVFEEFRILSETRLRLLPSQFQSDHHTYCPIQHITSGVSLRSSSSRAIWAYMYLSGCLANVSCSSMLGLWSHRSKAADLMGKRSTTTEMLINLHYTL